MHVTVDQCMNAMGEAIPLIVVFCLLKSCRDEFKIAAHATIRCPVGQARLVTSVDLAKWAGMFCRP